MKKVKYYSVITLLGLFGLSVVSCNDFLTLYPQDRVVEENFWEDKNDLEGVRYGAYKQMASTISNFIRWGDIRSDAYRWNQDNPNSTDDKEIMSANPDSTMGCYDWGGVYTTINFCNKVLSHGDIVLERDPQFTATEWEQMKAEMVGLRALNYFYLIRAFKDIPFTFDVINSDEDVRVFTNTSQMDVLNTLIDDVSAVAGKAKSRFPQEIDTKGLMTNTSIYALLAEMYLWRSALREGRGFPLADIQSDAQNVVYYGQRSLDALATQNTQIKSSTYDRGGTKTDDFGSGLQNAPLIQNEDMSGDVEAKSSSVYVDSYTSIFCSENSEESMFELQFSLTDERKSDFFRDIYGFKADKKYPLAVSQAAFLHALNGDTDMKDKDCRTWYSCQEEKYMVTSSTSDNDNAKFCYLLKWMDGYFNAQDKPVKTNINLSLGEDSYRNWIFYRMTDVMLMMAEAHAVLGNYDKCCKIVDAIQARSMTDQMTGLSKGEADEWACIDLVMRERLVELLGEGKRWFDLVRYAERKGGGTNPDPREPEYMDGAQGVKDMIDNYLGINEDYSQRKSTMKNRIKNRYGLYSPIYYRERSANKYQIPQNPVWNREKGVN